MKTAKQAQRDAKQLFRLCLVDGSLDEDRARRVVQRLVDAAAAGRSPSCRAFSGWCGSIATSTAPRVTSAVPLPPDIRARLEAGVARLYGRGIVTVLRGGSGAARRRAHHRGQRRLRRHVSGPAWRRWRHAFEHRLAESGEVHAWPT